MTTKEIDRINKEVDDSFDVISPEDLKIIAVGMGYKVRMCHNDNIVTVKADVMYGTHTEYNPVYFDSQMVEIMEKLASAGILEIDMSIKDKCCLTYDSVDYSAETLNLAVCRAAVEYFKGKM